MTKQIHILLALCLLNGTLTYGWFRLKAREHTLQQELSTFPVVRNNLVKAEKQLQVHIFPWKEHTNFADTQMRFEEFFKNALQKNLVWSPDAKPSPLRNGVVCHTGNVTAFFFYPQVRPFLKALSEHNLPVFIRSLYVKRNGLNNAGLQVDATFEALAINETTSVVATPPPSPPKHSLEATATAFSRALLPNE
ncbi:MAG: hypothetical protein IJ793_01270 [Opitutales bacterium]|nr:hypothetical protein [Opitutales bacterium]